MLKDKEREFIFYVIIEVLKETLEKIEKIEKSKDLLKKIEQAQSLDTNLLEKSFKEV